MDIQNVAPVNLPANSVLKFPMISFSSVYKFRKRTLARFLTVPVLSENSCSLPVFLLRELISPSYIAWLYQILPALPPPPTPTPACQSPTLTLQTRVSLLQFSHQGNLEATKIRVNSVFPAVILVYMVPVGVGACRLAVLVMVTPSSAPHSHPILGLGSGKGTKHHNEGRTREEPVKR